MSLRLESELSSGNPIPEFDIFITNQRHPQCLNDQTKNVETTKKM